MNIVIDPTGIPGANGYVDVPVPPLGGQGVVVPRLSPIALLSLYGSEQWESFIREWVSVLGYKRVIRPTGSGDRGIDIAGLTDDDGLLGVWDCYQCKHYKDALTPANALPEICKIVRAHLEGVISLPRAYYFLAPKGCGTSLTLLLAAPAKLADTLLEKLVSVQPPQWVRDLPDGAARDVANAIRSGSVDFSIFREHPVESVLDEHKRSRYHVTRFQVELPVRPENEAPPAAPESHREARYIEQLLDAYIERYGWAEAPDFDDVDANPAARAHMSRQRIAFYSAETLRRFARDEVPEGTFEALQSEVYSGVVEVAEGDHASPFNRLSATLTAAAQLGLSSNPLIPRVEVDDRKGMCHQLANDDRLVWRPK